MLDPRNRLRRSVRICILELFLQIFLALSLLRQHIIDLFLQLCAVIADCAGGSKMPWSGIDHWASGWWSNAAFHFGRN